MGDFASNHPDRFSSRYCRANMIGMAAGLTIGGKIPFTGTFANFSTTKSIRPNKTVGILFWKKNVKSVKLHTQD